MLCFPLFFGSPKTVTVNLNGGGVHKHNIYLNFLILLELKENIPQQPVLAPPFKSSVNRVPGTLFPWTVAPRNRYREHL